MIPPLTFKEFKKRILTIQDHWSPRALHYFAKKPPYREIQIEKAPVKRAMILDGDPESYISPNWRTIHAPAPPLKWLQRYILRMILTPAMDLLSTAPHGCVPGRSVVTNAAPHVGANLKIHMDLTDFFPTVTVQRVYGLFEKSFHYEKALAWMLANLCSYNGKLPQGAPTSPMIANIIARGLDRAMIGLASGSGAYYTRYVDDLTFSFRRWVGADELYHFIGEVARRVDVNGFIVNDAKTSVFSSRARMSVTGVVVNSKASLSREYRANLRASLHRKSLEDPGADPIEVIRGKLAYLKMVNQKQAAALMRAGFLKRLAPDVRGNLEKVAGL